MFRNVNTDLAAGIVGLVITTVFWFSLGDIGRMSIIFPKSMVGIMALISVALVVKGVFSPERKSIFDVGDQGRVVITGLALLIWILAIDWIGFFTASVVFFSFLTYYLARVRRHVSPARFGVWVLIIAAEVGIFYLVFTRLLYVPLPSGILI